jgi:hypothetical protein
MTASKKSSIVQNSQYKLAAAARREKIAAAGSPTDGLAPLNGRIRITLVGGGLSRENHASVFGPSSINIAVSSADGLHLLDHPSDFLKRFRALIGYAFGIHRETKKTGRSRHPNVKISIL